ALRHGMVDEERSVDVRAAAAEERARDVELRTLARERRQHRVAGEPGPRREVESTIGGAAADGDEPVAEMRRRRPGEHALDVREPRAVADGHLAQGIGLALG